MSPCTGSFLHYQIFSEELSFIIGSRKRKRIRNSFPLSLRSSDTCNTHSSPRILWAEQTYSQVLTIKRYFS